MQNFTSVQRGSLRCSTAPNNLSNGLHFWWIEWRIKSCSFLRSPLLFCQMEIADGYSREAPFLFARPSKCCFSNFSEFVSFLKFISLLLAVPCSKTIIKFCDFIIILAASLTAPHCMRPREIHIVLHNWSQHAPILDHRMPHHELVVLSNDTSKLT